MAEVENKGMGGYECDYCEKLMWAGVGGLRDARRRQFFYETRSKDLILVDGLAYCSRDCWDRANGREPVPKKKRRSNYCRYSLAY